MACATFLAREKAQVVLLHVLAAGALHAPHQLIDQALPELPALLTAEHDRVALALAQLVPGLFLVDPEGRQHPINFVGDPALTPRGSGGPGRDRAIFDRERRIRYYQLGVHLWARAEAVAIGTEPE